MVIETGRLTAPVTSVLPADVVLSADGSTLYVAGEDGKLRVYDVASRSLIATWDVGVRLGAIDLSPDGSFLIVAERQEVSSNGMSGWDRVATITTYKVATATGQVTSFPVQIYGYDGPFYDVAILADGSVLLTASMVGATGSAALLWTLDPATGGYTHLQSPYITEDTMLWASASGSAALIALPNISNGQMYLYEPGQGVTAQSSLYDDGYLQTRLSVQAISAEAGLVVQSSGKLLVRGLDLDLDVVLSDLHPEFGSFSITGLAFDGTGANLYILDEISDTITQVSTADWSIVRTFAVGREVTNPAEGSYPDGDFGNQLLVSPDGRYFTVVTGTGIQLIENDGLANTFTGTAGADLLNGGAGDDWIHGSGGDDDLDGGSGNDSLDGDEGNDVIRGGSGDDTLYVSGTGTDQVEGGAGGWDKLVVSYADDTGGITMSQPAADPNGGFTGSVTGTGRSVSYSGIEIFSITTGSGNDTVWGGGNTTAFPGIVSNQYSLGGGDDLFYSMGGTDTVDAGAGVDGFSGTLGGNGGAVFWSLQPTASPGFHNLYTGFEYFLSLTTGSGQDNITTANLNLNDSITLGAGNDSAILWNGNDSVNGGAAGAGATDSGLDTLILNYGQATTGVHNVNALTSNAAGYSGQFGDDSTRLATFEAIDRFLIATGTGADNIVTGDGNDEIRTGSGNDIANGGGGNDFIDGGSGDDSMTGGTGNDIYVVSSVGDVVTENAGEGTDEVRTGLATYVLAANVETLTATSDSAHDFRGNSGNNLVTGGAGNDFLRLQDGGNDTVSGGAGNDVFLFGSTLNGFDSVDGGAGTDQIAIQGGGPFTFGSAVISVESLAILSGTDQRFGDTLNNLYDYDITTRDVNVAAGVELVVDANKLLPGEDLTFNGSAETDGSFFIYGGRGTDTLTGGAKNDVFLFGVDGQWGASDRIVGGAGIDQLALRGNYVVTFGANQLVSIESIGLLSAHDTRFGPLGSSYTYDLTMNDANVAAGVQMTVDGAKLRIAENFTFNGAAETDGSFRVFGGLVDDTITGSQGNDILQGNSGADTLTGAGGADTFRYLSGTDSNASAMDHILDFTPTSDKIDLSRIDANTFVAGDQAFRWIGAAAFGGSGAASAGELRAYQDNNGTWFVEGDVNGDGVADIVIWVTTGPPVPLTSGDFLL